MKFVMDERVKHRITGVIVMVSIVVIFLPAMIKTSNQRFEGSATASLTLPTKPVPPQIAMPNKETMFRSVKVAHVVLPTPTNTTQPSKVASIASAVSLSKPTNKPMNKPMAVSTLNNPPVVASSIPPVSVIAKVPVLQVARVATTRPVKSVATLATPVLKASYGIQLASFSHERNATFLVKRLRQNGYSARYNALHTDRGTVYKVVVGQVNKKAEAISLQKQLAANMQLNGFVVNQNLERTA